MTVAACVISFALGLLCIDMFCDHYSLVSPSLTDAQLETCTSYYENAFHQPWYTSLVTLVPMVIGAVIMFRNITRTIYDMISVPAFLGVVGIFLFKIKASIEMLTLQTQASHTTKESYLRQIANDHVLIGVLLVLLLILQILAEMKVKQSKKKQA